MNPREIEVHIEELVLHNFEASARWTIADALETELQTLLRERGLPAAWQGNPERIDAGAFRLTSVSRAGSEIAGAVHRGGAR
jgi:hypothetical protein